MANEKTPTEGPDFALKTPWESLPEGKPVLGHVGDTPVLVARQKNRIFAVSPTCTHYGAPLQKGLVTQEGIHCPWHHACFRLTDGAVVRAPALNPLKSYTVNQSADTFYVTTAPHSVAAKPLQTVPASVTLVGLGAASMGAAAQLRARGYPGPITAFGDEGHMPYDRTKVSKGFLAGALKADGLAVNMVVAQDHGIAWRTQDRVLAIDTAKQVLQLADGTTHPYHALLLATGAAPKRLNVPGASLPHVHVLRTQDDAAALIKACGQATQVVIVGGSFIGLEAAAALCSPSRTITVVTPHHDAPMAGVLGDTLAQVLFEKHKGAGIRFKQGRTVTQIAKKGVTLDDGTVLACDRVLLAVGVAPNVALAKSANLPTDDGILVSQELQTCAPQIWAAGDVARYATGTPKETQRIEHWAVAMRMGQVAADNMLGDHTAYTTTPYFWTAQHGINIRYVGHAPKGSQATVYGDFNAGRGAVALQHNGRIQAVATVGCDPVSLACEAAFDEKAPQRIPALLRAAF